MVGHSLFHGDAAEAAVGNADAREVFAGMECLDPEALRGVRVERMSGAWRDSRAVPPPQ